MRVLLLNDNGNIPHVGCLGVADAHARMLARAGHTVAARRFCGWSAPVDPSDEEGSIRRLAEDAPLREAIEAADAVVLNAEGTIHHGAGLHWLAAVGAAQRLGKTTLVVNAVFEESAGFLGVLHAAADVGVRDARSLRYLASLGVKARLVPDSIVEARFDQRPAIDLSGRIVVTDWHHQRKGDVGAAAASLLRDRPAETFYFPLLHGSHRWLWRSAVPTLRTARAVVTGRHHGVYLAALAGVPFVAMPSNTHKVEGIFEGVGVDVPICTTRGQVDRALEAVLADAGACRRVSDHLTDSRPLDTFRALGVVPVADPDAAERRELERLEVEATEAAAWTRVPMFWPFAMLDNIKP
ncbi:MAG: polysaccharide pyruvyl transferase family protein [Phycisphaeraceae bacterium]|nr:polysaccharide pyruvyl transferase family protein [Phycisphaeraceae bacterium]